MRSLLLVCTIGLLFYVSLLTAHPVPHESGEARIGGNFTLTDAQGKTVKDTDFRGRLMLVYMGYSHCPDICPMTLGVISAAIKKLGADADKAAFLFISLDPGRDSPQVLKTYLAAFDPHIIGLTGTPEAVAKLAKAYAIYANKTAGADGSYRIDHSGLFYLMDRQGKYLAHFGPDAKPQELAAAIRAAE